MFVGHYGAAFAAKRWAPRVSLGVLFVAVQLVDVLFCLALLTGVEKMRIVPHFTAYNPYDLYSMPWTHSLLAAIGWSLLAAIGWAIFGAREDRARASIVVGLAVLSHWLLDLPMHTPDLQLVPWSATRVGFGHWHHRGVSLACELVVLLFGVGLYVWALPAHTERGRRRVWAFVALLVVLGAVTPFLPDPPGIVVWSLQALFAYVALAWVAARVDRARAHKPVT